MIPLAKLQQNLGFNKDLGELIEVMKLAATLQFNQFRNRKGPTSEFLTLLEEAFNVIYSQQIDNIFLRSNSELPKALILVSSDEGFLGELNALLVNKMMGVRQTQDEIIVVGSQGADYLSTLNINFNLVPSFGDKVEFKQLSEFRNDLLRRYINREISAIYIVYPHFISIASQQVESEILLPLPKFVSNKVDARLVKEFLIEPDFDSVLKGWVKLWMGFRLYQIFWTAKMAEYAARIMHLESSIQELNRVNQRLRVEYFKHVHSISDKNIREVSASRMLGRH